MYLEPGQRSMMKLFYENSQGPSSLNYFGKRISAYMFSKVLNTHLHSLLHNLIIAHSWNVSQSCKNRKINCPHEGCQRINDNKVSTFLATWNIAQNEK